MKVMERLAVAFYLILFLGQFLDSTFAAKSNITKTTIVLTIDNSTLPEIGDASELEELAVEDDLDVENDENVDFCLDQIVECENNGTELTSNIVTEKCSVDLVFCHFKGKCTDLANRTIIDCLERFANCSNRGEMHAHCMDMEYNVAGRITLNIPFFIALFVLVASFDWQR